LTARAAGGQITGLMSLAPPPASAPALHVEALTCRRNERVLFSDVSFSLAAGGALALVGPNGVGKTSLLRILGGLLRAERGAVRLLPADGEHDLPQRGVFVSSRDPLKAAMSVSELLASWRAVVFGEGAGPVAAALAAFDLTPLADVPCAYLSSGQRRRVSLARLMLAPAGQRPLWLLDEPTNALDAHARRRLAEVVARHRAGGGLVVAATHDPLDWPGLMTLDLGRFRPMMAAGGPADAQAALA
jgi:heme exporter protein A